MLVRALQYFVAVWDVVEWWQMQKIISEIISEIILENIFSFVGG